MTARRNNLRLVCLAPGLNISGNIVELLYYHCSRGDTNLKHHLKSAAQNFRYTCTAIQNKLIDCCVELIIEQIVAVVKENRYYFILADELSAMKE